MAGTVVYERGGGLFACSSRCLIASIPGWVNRDNLIRRFARAIHGSGTGSGSQQGAWAHKGPRSVRVELILVREGSLLGRAAGDWEGVILDDSGEKELFWGRGAGFCSLERVAGPLRRGLPLPRTSAAPETFLDFGSKRAGLMRKM